MQRFVDAVRSCVTTENWYGALVVALILPDICGRIQDPAERSSRRRYERWFDEYLASDYKMTMAGIEHVFLSARDCYALRCSVLHEGTDDTTEQEARDVLRRFYFTTMPMHNIRVEDTLTLNVAEFCEGVCVAVERWLAKHQEDGDIQARLNELLSIHDTAFSPHPGVRLGTDDGDTS